jgi:hypothetical protein
LFLVFKYYHKLIYVWLMRYFIRNNRFSEAFIMIRKCIWQVGAVVWEIWPFCFDFNFFYKLNYLQLWSLREVFLCFKIPLLCNGWRIPKSYQSYLKIERLRILSKLFFDIERLCLSNNKWNWSFSDSNQWETVQQFIYSIASEVNACRRRE